MLGTGRIGAVASRLEMFAGVVVKHDGESALTAFPFRHAKNKGFGQPDLAALTRQRFVKSPFEIGLGEVSLLGRAGDTALL